MVEYMSKNNSGEPDLVESTRDSPEDWQRLTYGQLKVSPDIKIETNYLRIQFHRNYNNSSFLSARNY